jgi:hypothetical protein
LVGEIECELRGSGSLHIEEVAVCILCTKI